MAKTQSTHRAACIYSELTEVILQFFADIYMTPKTRFLFFRGQYGTEKEQIAVTAADGWKLVVIGPDIRRPGGCTSADHRIELYNLNDDPFEGCILICCVRALPRKVIAGASSTAISRDVVTCGVVRASSPSQAALTSVLWAKRCRCVEN